MSAIQLAAEVAGFRFTSLCTSLSLSFSQLFSGGWGRLCMLGPKQCVLVLPSHLCPSLLQCIFNLRGKLVVHTIVYNCQCNANHYPEGICRSVLLPGPLTFPNLLTKACSCTSQRLEGFQHCSIICWKRLQLYALSFMPRHGKCQAAWQLSEWHFGVGVQEGDVKRDFFVFI